MDVKDFYYDLPQELIRQPERWNTAILRILWTI